MKRYVYTGPPAINLGSWSERPSINVQIKMDTDYKLGRNNNNTNGGKSFVNVDERNERDIENYSSDINKNNIANHKIKINSSANRNPDERELTRKLIAHTTASGFKMPTSNRVNVFDPTKKDRPFVMGVELKKSFIETPKEMSKYSENENDASRNVRELTTTFGQHMNFKQKPKRVSINRHSVNYDTQFDEVERLARPNAKQNGHAKFAKASNQDDLSFKRHSWTYNIQENSQAKRYTSIVGINETSQNFRPQSEPASLRCNFNNTVKINPPMPVVKGFKIPITDSKTNNNQVNRKELSTSENIQPPKLPTIPVITGVTLKSANPKPKSVQLDSRDTLLESIRNFRREKLKNVSTLM